MSEAYDAAVEVRAAIDSLGNEVSALTYSLPDQLERIATAALQGLLSASYGEEGYVPSKTDRDFAPDDEGLWHKSKWGWVVGNVPEGAKRFRYVGTDAQRFAHDAVQYADALIAELSKTEPPTGATT